MTEKFSLKWNDYQSNWSKSLSKLRKDTEFADVTLITEDKVKFSAHKVVLSSLSNMFKVILKETNSGKSVLYLGGVSSENLECLMDYIYYGEVNVFQVQLDSFLESGKKLEIDGLIGQERVNQDIENIIDQKDPNSCNIVDLYPPVKIDNSEEVNSRKQYSYPAATDLTMIEVKSLTSEELKLKILELFKKIDGLWTCLACDFTTRSKCNSNMKKHVETHIDGLSYSCNLCDNEYRSRNSLYQHKHNAHKANNKDK